jgi:hypothetical protein
MVKTLNYETTPETKGGEFLKWTAGNNLVKFLTAPVAYDKVWKDGQKTTETICFVADCSDGNKIKAVNLKLSIRQGLKNFVDANGVQPHDPKAPIFNVSRVGTGKNDTRYSVSATMKYVNDLKVDYATLEKDLLAFATKLETGDNTPAPIPGQM